LRQLTLIMGPARVEVCSFVQRTTILSKRFFFLHSYINAIHTINIIYMLPYCMSKKIYSLLCRLKINNMTEIWNMHLFLARCTLRLHIIGYTDTTLFLTIGKAEDVLSPYIGKSDIYCRKVLVSWQLI
jgi:hypothetical protein